MSPIMLGLLVLWQCGGSPRVSRAWPSPGSVSTRRLDEPPDAGPHVRWCGRGRGDPAPYPISYTAGFGSEPDLAFRRSLVRSRRSYTRRPQRIDLRKPQMEPRPGHIPGMIKLSARLYACFRSAEQ